MYSLSVNCTVHVYTCTCTCTCSCNTHFLHDTIEHIVNALCNKCKFQLDVNVLQFNDRYH